MSAFTFDEAQLNLQGVKAITVSTIQPDTGSTQYVRLIQVWSSNPTAQGARPMLVLSLYGGDQTITDQSELEIQTPTLEF